MHVTNIHPILPVLLVVDDTGDFLDPVCVVPVYQILTMVVSRAEEMPQPIVAEISHWSGA